MVVAVAGFEYEGVVAGAAVQPVVAFAAVDGVLVLAAVDFIISTAAVEDVPALLTVDGVIAASAVDLVVEAITHIAADAFGVEDEVVGGQAVEVVIAGIKPVSGVQSDLAATRQVNFNITSSVGYIIFQIIQGGDGSEGAQVDLVLTASNSKAVDLIVAIAGGEHEGIAAAAAGKGIIFLATGDDATTVWRR